MKLPVTRASKTKPSPTRRHEKPKQSLTSPCDRQDARRKKSHGVASLTPLSEEEEEDWQLARTFHSIFFYAVHAEKKKEESQVLIANKLSHSD